MLQWLYFFNIPDRRTIFMAIGAGFDYFVR